MPTLPTHQHLVNFPFIIQRRLYRYKSFTYSSLLLLQHCCQTESTTLWELPRPKTSKLRIGQLRVSSLECCYYSNCRNSQDDDMHNCLQTFGILLVCPSVVQIMLQAMNHMPNKWSLLKLVSFRGSGVGYLALFEQVLMDVLHVNRMLQLQLRTLCHSAIYFQSK